MSASRAKRGRGAPDPVTIQVIASALRSICEEMGAALVRASYSANIKERRDCSTALFDSRGRLVAQAEHIPVHLGAMPDAVAAVLAEDPAPGDVFILNDPFRGGTHLPDITLVSAIEREGEVIAFAASRAHHADVGGREPGSMPADSTTLEEEGVVIPPTRLVAAGELEEDFLRDILSRMRRPQERRGDLEAQLGAATIAARRLNQLVDRKGMEAVSAAMAEAPAYSERRMHAAIASLPDGVYRAEDYLERDARDLVIAVRVEVRGEEIFIDFEGTSPQEEGNLNCPMSVTRSACYYAVRVVTDPDIPPNAGSLAPVRVSAPEGSLVNARPPAAVAGGNVEASQRIADAVLLAFAEAVDLPAQGQGTMNNLTIGNDDFNYYETIGGGAGACPDRDGASGIHLGTTNTLNTPIEALEMAYPLRVERYELRRGSGGSGRHRGGDGIVRTLRLLAPARLSLLADRRRHGPRGAGGGEAGMPGRDFVNDREVPPKLTRSLEQGDMVRIETPGGGGYGAATADTAPAAPAAGKAGKEKEAAAAAKTAPAAGAGGGLGVSPLLVLALLLALDLAMGVLFLLTRNSPSVGLMRAFHLDVEYNVPSTYSTLQLILAGVFAFKCARVDRERRLGGVRASTVWLAISAVLMIMAADEFFAIHERSDYLLYGLYGRYPSLAQLGGYAWPWTVFGFILAVAVAVPMARYTWRIFAGRRRYFFLLALAGLIFVVAAAGIEDFDVYMLHFHAGFKEDYVTLVEEVLEMVAVSLAAFVFVAYRRSRLREKGAKEGGDAAQ